MTTQSSLDADSLFRRGNAFLSERQFEQAFACYHEARRLRPDHPETLANIGVGHAEQAQYEEALEWYAAAIRLQPRYPEAHYNRGNALHALRRYVEALAAFDAAIAAAPRFARAWNNRGLALIRLGRANEAVISYRQAIALQPGFARAWVNLGLAEQTLGHLDDAVRQFDECLRQVPNFVPARANRAQAWLLKGDFENGWPEYEWRCRLPAYQRFPRDLPMWDGSPLEGRSLLIRYEQGLGDTIQFVRYARLVRERGGRVVLECPSSLQPLLASVEGIDRLVDRNTPDTGCDCQVWLLSLPGLFRTDNSTVPAPIPYLAAEPARVEHWRSRLPHGKKLVGISWQGSPDYPEDVFRSIPLAAFAPLARLPGIQLVSLQKGLGTEQIPNFRENHSLLELGEELDRDQPFLDTSAVIASLDLVVAADTSIGHLAGALGRPVWLALTLSPEWRWQLGRTDTPWYPGHQLFRQQSLGDWEEVFRQMAGELCNTAWGVQ